MGPPPTEEEADQGDAEIRFQRARAYRYGLGVPSDLALALRWYRRAAAAGHAGAQCAVGVFLYHGWAIPQDTRLAAAWFRRAAEAGDRAAQFNLGGCYEEGSGVARDEDRARTWYRRAAAQGFPPALETLRRLGE